MDLPRNQLLAGSAVVLDPRDGLVFACVSVCCYDVAPDRQRFYGTRAVAPPPPPAVTHINLIQNWFEELKAKVPVE